jgi:hypothetical protein
MSGARSQIGQPFESLTSSAMSIKITSVSLPHRISYQDDVEEKNRTARTAVRGYVRGRGYQDILQRQKSPSKTGNVLAWQIHDA